MRWAGKNVLHIGTNYERSSSDGPFGYVNVSSKIILSILLCFIWTLANRKRNNYNKLFYWLRVYVRYFLAFVMLGYGFAKFFNMQFSAFPDPDQLVKSYGESSPMGLLWRFMGYSTSYKIFTGAAEVLGGLLLLFRRTTTLGALVLIVVMSNVVMLNISYDVSVKLHSMNLLLMVFFILAADIKRVINFFLLNKATLAVEIKQSFRNKKMRIGKVVLKWVMIIYLLYITLSWYVEWHIKTVSNPPYQSFNGIYNIETFVKNRDTLPPLTTDTIRWNKMTINSDGINIRLMNDSLKNYVFKPDTVKKTITMFMNTDSTNKYLLRYYELDAEHLVIQGILEDDSVYIKMKKYDLNNFRLVNWRSSWIRQGRKNY